MRKEKNHKKSLVIVSIVLGALLFAGTYGINQVVAGEEEKISIIQEIAKRFNLKEEEVRTVFEEHRKKNELDRLKMVEEKLSRAVANGALTEEQKKIILDKSKELGEKRSALSNLSKEERQNEIRRQKESLKQWAEENNIELRKLAPYLGKELRKNNRSGNFGRGF